MTIHETPRLLVQGDAAVTVEFADAPGDDVHARVLGFADAVAEAARDGVLAGVVEAVPALTGVTVHVDGDDPDAADARDAALLALAERTAGARRAPRAWRFPACFDADAAPDLAAMSAALGVPAARVVERLAAVPLRVHMLGFLPGFAYMGDLPEDLAVPRLASPRRAVPPRSIAVAGRMCAVYPWTSPGGWHLVGRTPVRLFDVADAEPALLRPGDVVRWRVVDAATLAELERAVDAGEIGRDAWRDAAGTGAAT